MTGLSEAIQAGFRRRGLVTAMLLSLAACGPSTTRQAVLAASTPEPAADYQPPPTPMAIEASGGREWLTGHARGASRVRLTTIPTAQPVYAPTDAAGDFRIALSGGGSARMYALAMEIAPASGPARLVQAEGYVFVAPDGRAALLRAGAGAQVLGQAGAPLRVTALDHDRAGGAVISGAGPAGAVLNAQVDGVSRGHAPADASGRFSIALEPLTAGGRTFAVAGGGQTASVSLEVSNPPALTQGLFRAERTAFGWRVDWLTPGRGLQSTLIMD